jgi:hypothetical protein
MTDAQTSHLDLVDSVPTPRFSKSIRPRAKRHMIATSRTRLRWPLAIVHSGLRLLDVWRRVSMCGSSSAELRRNTLSHTYRDTGPKPAG